MSRYTVSEFLEKKILHKNILNFRLGVRKSFIRQMLMTQLLEAHRESHIGFSDLTGNRLIMTITPEIT